VPFAAGGPTDLLARTVATRLAESLGQPVVVDNRPGAAGAIAAEHMARAAPDGYTLMMVTLGTQAINPALYRQLAYDPLRHFTYISTVGVYSLVMAANPRLGANTAGELVAQAKARPNGLSYGSAGAGASGHLASELFKATAGIQVQHIPYKGSAAAMLGLMSGDLAFVFDLVSTALPHIRSGKVRALAWSGKQRSPLLPDVPTFAEAGLPGFEVTGWIGIAAPADVPREVVERLHASLSKAVAAPDIRDSLLAQGYEISVIAPDAFSALVRSDMAKWGKVVRDAGVKAD
jgi:tripartite-type tricarboxylate transporter receptor subunit TctC